MKNYLFTLLSVVMCLNSFVSCKTNVVQEDETANLHGRQKAEKSVTLFEIAGEAHNNAIYAFGDYFSQKQLDLFVKDGFSEEVLAEYSKYFLNTYMEKNYKEIWEATLNESGEINQENLDKLKEKLSYVVLNEPIDKIGDIINDVSSDYCGVSQTDAEKSAVLIICGVSKYSANLWTYLWDWDTSSIIPDNIVYTSSSDGNKDGDNEKTDAEKELEEQKRKAELEKLARKVAAADMFGAIVGAMGGPETSLAAAIGNSLEAYVNATMLEVAENIDTKTIDKESYFFQDLDNLLFNQSGRIYCSL